MRGEKIIVILRVLTLKGSPPRARGEVPCGTGRAPEGRITPACAGRSPPGTPAHAAEEDHPRVRGEKPASTGGDIDGRGSPPRARGEAGPDLAALAEEGITPACAGRSDESSELQELEEDHPRVRGEKMWPWWMPGSLAGSPPRARGEGFAKYWLNWSRRITPACAGRSQSLAH